MKYFIIAASFWYLVALATSFRFMSSLRHHAIRSDSFLSMALPRLGGKIVVSGVGDVDEDEFFLNLLNEQSVWDPVILATSDDAAVKKRFLSRTARYSGLLNILQIVKADTSNVGELTTVLENANAWIAVGVPQSSIPEWSQIALKNNLKRVIFSTELEPHRINETVIPEFDVAIEAFEAAGSSFTGIRHGQIIDGDENFPYEIVNATIPCLEPTVERGVLGRVLAELLRIESASNIKCGVSSSSTFAGAYLNILRSSGLTRQQEVEKVLQGGIQRVARLTVASYEKRKALEDEARVKAEQRKIEIEKEKAKERERMADVALATTTKSPYDEEEEIIETRDTLINRRSEEILKNVWAEYDTRMYTKFSSKVEFFEANKEQAIELATKEIDEEIRLTKEREKDALERKDIIERLVDVNRQQYAKLLKLERQEMQRQREISDILVKYIYLLLEYTLADCEKKNILFYNLDEYAQTMILRAAANELRAMVNIPAYDVVYDELDANVIVDKLSNQNFGKQYGLDQPADVILKLLEDKYASLLKSVAALRGASQLIEIAIEMLKKELPPPPPTVSEARQAESVAMRQSVSKSRLESIRNRGQPSTEGESVVGRL